MTDANIFTLFGLVYVAVGVGVFNNASMVKKLVDDLSSNRAVSYLSGFFAAVIGFAIVATHNVWTKDVTVIVTLLGWIALVKGLLLIAVPEWSVAISKAFVKKGWFPNAFGVFVTVLGAAFLWLGLGR